MRHPLPYAFARSTQLLLEDDGQQLLLWHPAVLDSATLQALSEVQRKYAVQQWASLPAPALAQRISAAYAQGESSAASVVSESVSNVEIVEIINEFFSHVKKGKIGFVTNWRKFSKPQLSGISF